MKFEEAVMHILMYEGGYVYDSNDPGGETKFGISKRAYPACNIKDLTEDKAKSIYKMDYWDVVYAEKLKPAIRLLVFDAAVNHGPNIAIKFLQRVCGVKEDGIIGPITKRALEDVSDMEFIDRYAMLRLDLYTSLPHWQHYGKGWAKRLLEVSLLCAFYAELQLS